MNFLICIKYSTNVSLTTNERIVYMILVCVLRDNEPDSRWRRSLRQQFGSCRRRDRYKERRRDECECELKQSSRRVNCVVRIIIDTWFHFFVYLPHNSTIKIHTILYSTFDQIFFQKSQRELSETVSKIYMYVCVCALFKIYLLIYIYI